MNSALALALILVFACAVATQICPVSFSKGRLASVTWQIEYSVPSEFSSLQTTQGVGVCAGLESPAAGGLLVALGSLGMSSLWSLMVCGSLLGCPASLGCDPMLFLKGRAANRLRF